MKSIWNKIKFWLGIGAKKSIEYVKEHPEIIDKVSEIGKEIIK